MQRRSLVPLLFLALTLAPRPASAAECIIQGKIVDPQGAGIGEVSIVAADKSSGRNFKGKSDEDGKYYVRGLLPAEYEITYAKEGFTSHTWSGKLSAGKSETIDITLQKKGSGGNDAASAAARAAEIQAMEELGKDFEDAVAKFNAKDYDGAIAGFQKVIAKKPDIADPYYNIGLCYQKKKDFAQAATWLAKAIERKPDHAGAHFNLAFAQFQLKKPAEGRASLQKTLELDAGADTAYNAGALLKNFGENDQALEMFRKATSIDPAHAQAYREAGYLFVTKGDTASAKTALGKYVELAPTAPDAAEVKGMLAELP